MRESRPYGSVRGARDETRVPTATRLCAAVQESGIGTGAPARRRTAAAPAIGKSGSVLISFFVGDRTDNLLKAEICLRARLKRQTSKDHGAS